MSKSTVSLEEEVQIVTRQFEVVKGMCLFPTGLLTFLKELFRRFKISSSIPVRIPSSLKWMGPVKPSVLTC